MFTGIVKDKGKVRRIEEKKGVLSVAVSVTDKWKIKLGESIAVNGVCSTVARNSAKEIGFEYMPETLRVSNVRSLQAGQIVNLEPSLRHGDPVDGHFVTGHVDTVGEIVKLRREEGSKTLEVSLAKEFLKYVVYKGSVTVDGVALTVSKKFKNTFEVSLIPYTLSHTNLDERKIGDIVNIECDIIAKYIYAKKR